jgi:mercuric ion transport protein
MKIEVLYLDGCPNHRLTVERVKESLKHEGLVAEVVEVKIRDDAAARSAGFLGSPTVRIDGLDVEPSARLTKEFGMMCRTYTEGGTRVGLPSQRLIGTALREAANGRPSARECCEVPTTTAPSSEPAIPKRRKLLLGASVAAAIGASLCCILPILAAVTGAGAIAAGVAFEKWRPYLLGVTGLLLASGFLVTYRDHKRACAAGSLCAAKPMSRWNYIALGILAAGVVALAAFPYYSGAVARMVVRQPGPTHSVSSVTLSTVTFRVPDMDCPACAVSLSATLRQLPGVADAKLDVSSRQAVVTYDSAIQNVAALAKVISGAGFHIASGPRSS